MSNVLIITILLVILKITGVLNIGWFWVFLLQIIDFAIYFVVFFIAKHEKRKRDKNRVKEFYKRFDDIKKQQQRYESK